MEQKQKSIFYTLVSYFFLIIFLLPIFWICLLSLTKIEFNGVIQVFGIPEDQYSPTLASWKGELRSPELYSSITRSLIIAPISTIIALILGLQLHILLRALSFLLIRINIF